jgi:hypothetical protein
VNRLKFGIDFDNTITAAPTEFAFFIRTLLTSGHEVKIVTWRKPDVREDIDAYFDQYQLVVPVVFCNGKAKKLRYDADIWIDDFPCAIDFSLTRPPHFSTEYDPEEQLKLEDPTNANGQEVLVNHRALYKG